MEVVILCDGSFPTHHIPLKVLDAAEKVICCDGATVKLLAYGMQPFAIVGDMDSLPLDLQQYFKDKVYLDACQETNDQTKAVKWCAERGFNDIILLGATGIREDHTIANISLLADYSDMVNIKMITDTGIFTPVCESSTFDSYPGQQVSIFSITPDTLISTEGLKFNVSARRFLSWYQGSLNQAQKNKFKIEIDRGKLVVFTEHIK